MLGGWYFILCKEQVMNGRAKCTGPRNSCPSSPPSLQQPQKWPPHHITDGAQGFVRLMLICRVKPGGQYLLASYRAKSKLLSQHLGPAVIQASARLADLFSSHSVDWLSHHAPSMHYPFLLLLPLPEILTPSQSLFSTFPCPF